MKGGDYRSVWSPTMFNPHKPHMGGNFLLIVALLILVEFNTAAHVSALPFVAITLYDHGLVKDYSWTANGHFVPINKTSTFTEDDNYAYAYFTAQLSAANITWAWYDPSGALFRQRTQQVHCVVSPCTFLDYLGIAHSPARTSFGLWRLDLIAGTRLYSDCFYLTPIINQEDQWKFSVEQSAPSHIHGEMTVTIHPSNATWSSYRIYMPYAANLTAYDASTKQPLNIVPYGAPGSGGIVLDLGGAQSNGYRFVISFYLAYSVASLSGWDVGNFAFIWRDYAWMRFNDVHPIPETFNITLPFGASIVDMVGFNAMTLNGSITGENAQPSISFETTLLPGQDFGWSIIYRDFTWRDSNPSTASTSAGKAPLSSEQILPVVHLTLGSVSLWTAVMAIFLLTGSELLSPIYAKSGFLMNRKRLRIAGLVLVAIFLATTAYRLLVISR